jgi:predicted dehydrogenase
LKRRSDKRLGVALIGAGFINTFHVKGWPAVRDSEIIAIFSRTLERAKKLALLCRKLGVGDPKCYDDVSAAIDNPDVDAAWIGVPNDARLDIVKRISKEKTQGKSNIIGVACDKPLARTILEAKEMISLVEKAGLLHGYLENQVFAPSLVKGRETVWSHASKVGRPYLARASEEHGGPHEPWFWMPSRSGGGVLIDMMCHSLEATRFLLTSPKEVMEQLKVKTVSAEIGSLKWTRPEYARKLKDMTKGLVDYRKHPAEDFAKALITYQAPTGETLMAETTVLWSFTGPGLKLSFELMGPEYYMAANTLTPDLHVFFSRNLKPATGEYLVEKQEADQGLMPTIADEAFTYGYQGEDRHMVNCFLAKHMPEENWYNGLFILKLIMTCYMSAERAKRLDFPPPGLEGYTPLCVSGKWKP